MSPAPLAWAVFWLLDLSRMTGTVVLDVTGTGSYDTEISCHGTAIRQEGTHTGPRTWAATRKKSSIGWVLLACSVAGCKGIDTTEFTRVPARLLSWRCAPPSTVIGT